jgi:hypothetical protein
MSSLPPPSPFTPGTGTGPGGITPILRNVIVTLAVGLVLLALGYDGWSVGAFGFWIGNFRPRAFFFLLALLPGASAIVHHIVATSTRRQRGVHALMQFYQFRDGRTEKRQVESPGRPGDVPTMTGAICSALFLTSVFLLVAAVADRARGKVVLPADGIVFAGIGAYVSVIYYMGARMYANSLSARFLTTSALKSASTIAFGWVAVSIGLTSILPNQISPYGALFLCGLFYSWAIGALRSKAMTWFGAPKTDNEELPIGIIEGIDDTTADLLSEYGVTTVQHLTTSDPADLCERTLIPLNRIIDWIDQAMLIQAVKRSIVPLRAGGIRAATELARLYLLAEANDATSKKTLDSLAEKCGLGSDALRGIAERLAGDFNTRLIYEFVEGRPLGAELPRDIVAIVDALVLPRYEVAPPAGGPPIGRLQIRNPPPAPPPP